MMHVFSKHILRVSLWLCEDEGCVGLREWRGGWGLITTERREMQVFEMQSMCVSGSKESTMVVLSWMHF
jgi:hypothetical protein